MQSNSFLWGENTCSLESGLEGTLFSHTGIRNKEPKLRWIPFNSFRILLPRWEVFPGAQPPDDRICLTQVPPERNTESYITSDSVYACLFPSYPSSSSHPPPTPGIPSEEQTSLQRGKACCHQVSEVSRGWYQRAGPRSPLWNLRR